MCEIRGCGRFKVGYQGQQYEVRFFDEGGNEKRMGWTNKPDGGALMASAKLMPGARDPFLVDLWAEDQKVIDAAKARKPVLVNGP